MKNFLTGTAFALLILLCGCASTNAPKADPFEGLNRATYAFNDATDRALLKPIAQGYKAVTPDFFRAGVSNAFSNLGDVAVSLNNFLQGKPREGVSDVGRFLVNSTLGLLGLFDLATPMGLESHNEDFGQTLGKWGVGPGPYLVIPFMGPSTLRDSLGRVVDSQAGWGSQVDHVRTRNAVRGFELVNVRASLLGAGESLDQAALDKYQFLRDAYLQRRLRMVNDGRVTQDQLDKLDDDLASPPPPKK
jgi:phospholipid-binding lipoprotein MlaA